MRRGGGCARASAGPMISRDRPGGQRETRRREGVGDVEGAQHAHLRFNGAIVRQAKMGGSGGGAQVYRT